MRHVIPLACLLLLAACGRPATPLSDAIDALRAGDRAALQNAKADADEALKTAVRPDSDLCAMTGDDIRKYSEAARIRKFDDPALFRLPEVDRLVYALNVAGSSPQVTDDSPLRRAPLVRAIADHDPDAMRNCKDVDGRMGSALSMQNVAALAAHDNAEGARATALKSWVEDLRHRVGAGAFDAKMKDAAADLENANFAARWPVETEFFGEERVPTFQEVQAVTH